MLKGIIFDLDGTITMTEELHHKALAQVFQRYGIDYPFAQHIERFAGTGSRITFETIFHEKAVSISPEEFERCRIEKQNLYTKFVQGSDLAVVPGVQAFVQHVHEKGLKKIIATGNSDLGIVRFILEKIGLAEYFPDIISITEVPRGKPFPEVFLEAAKRMVLFPSDCVVLEDAVNGVTAAREAHIRCIAFETTTAAPKLLAAGASIVLKDYTQLTDDILYETQPV